MSDPTEHEPKLTPAQEFDHQVRQLVNRNSKSITVAEAVGVLTHIATQISNAAIVSGPRTETMNDQPAPKPAPAPERCSQCNAPLAHDRLRATVRELRSIIQDAAKLADRIDAHADNAYANAAELQRLVNLPYPMGERQ